LDRKISAIAGKVAAFAVRYLYAGMFRNQNDGAPVYRRTVTITDVKEGSSELPRDFALLQNYPNPLNPTTTIRYELPRTGSVSLKVFDVLGREVRTLVDEVQDVGSKAIELDATGLASGVYFYRLIAGEFVATKKIILAK